jgi:hypothetical protein
MIPSAFRTAFPAGKTLRLPASLLPCWLGAAEDHHQQCSELIGLMDGAPYDFIRGHQEHDLKRFLQFKHRTFNATDALVLHRLPAQPLRPARLSGRRLCDPPAAG